MDMVNKLFVYGSLGPDGPNRHVLKNIGGSFEKATIHGTLHQEGWGAALGYPGIVLDDGGEEIEGFLFCSDSLSAHWSELDEFEGEGYERVLATVELQNKNRVEAFLYILSRLN